MANGPETHEWRLGELERRMDKLEQRIQAFTYALIGNLVGVVLLLATTLLNAWGK